MFFGALWALEELLCVNTVGAGELEEGGLITNNERMVGRQVGRQERTKSANDKPAVDTGEKRNAG